MKKCISLGPFCVLLLAVALYSCSTAYRNFEDCHNTIVFHNQSGKAIYYASTLKEGFLNYDPTRPDHAADYKILPGESRKIKIGITLSCWEQVLKSADGYLYIYVYDAATLESGHWPDEKQKPFKKYTLDVKQLGKMDWKISYP